ncbi:flippase-like domain-containing protein [bacterium]|nr:flippase-like domain-containing protein [bacterium]
MALKGVRLNELGTELSNVSWVTAFLIGLVSLLSSAIRAYRWEIAVKMFSPVSFRNVFSSFMVGVFGLNVIPARVGELLRVVVLARNSSLSHSSTLATVVFERLVDGLVLVILFAVSLWLYPAANPSSLFGADRGPYLMIIPVLFFAFFVLLILFWRHPDTWTAFLHRHLAWAGRLGETLPGMLKRFAAGLVIFSDGRRMAAYLFWSFIAWIGTGVYFQLNFIMLDIPLGLGPALVVLTATAVGAMIPAAPGFVGTYHAFCKTALMAFGVSDARALTFAVVTHLVSYLINTLIGFICALRENVQWSDLKRPGAGK